MSTGPSGRTELAAVIGRPIRHSLSPALFNAAFVATGLDWVFVALELEEGRAAVAIDALRHLGVRGLSVTMPHKAAMAALVDELTPTAAALGVVNSVFPRHGRIMGTSTDGDGFVDSLREEGVDPEGLSVVVLGAGGAARAVVLALGQAGARRIGIVNRSPQGAEQAAALVPERAHVVSAQAAGEADLIVNATPVGLGSDPSLPLEASLLGPGQVVADLVYHPLVTPLLAAAQRRGARTVGGLGMLVHQAGYQFQAWTGLEAPLGAMAEAARSRIAPSSSGA
jgi:shikimate dehydrogenase